MTAQYNRTDPMVADQTGAEHQHGPSVTPLPLPRNRSLDPESFKRAFRNHAAGVAVVTASGSDGPVGLTATSVFSVSAEPPLVVFSLSGSSSSAPGIRTADTAVVHLLGADQIELARLCATSGVDRFADRSLWSELDTGEPVFHGAPVWMRGRIIERVEAGQSTLVVLHVLESHLPDADDDEFRPLVYHNRTWHGLHQLSRIDV